jgi:hypothetical protein
MRESFEEEEYEKTSELCQKNTASTVEMKMCKLKK